MMYKKTTAADTINEKGLMDLMLGSIGARDKAIGSASGASEKWMEKAQQRGTQAH
jgi:hypothetical protein